MGKNVTPTNQPPRRRRRTQPQDGIVPENSFESTSLLQKAVIAACFLLVFSLCVVGLMSLAGYGQHFKVIEAPVKIAALEAVSSNKTPKAKASKPLLKAPATNSTQIIANEKALKDAFERGRAEAYKQFLAQQQMKLFQLPDDAKIRHSLTFDSQNEALRYAKDCQRNALKLIQQKSHSKIKSCYRVYKVLTLGRAALTVVRKSPAQTRLLKQQIEDQLNDMRVAVLTSDWKPFVKQQLLTMFAEVKLLGDSRKLTIVKKQGIGQANRYTVTAVLQNDNPAIVKNIKIKMQPFDETKTALPVVVLNGPRVLEKTAQGRYSGSYFGTDAENIASFELIITVDE